MSTSRSLAQAESETLRLETFLPYRLSVLANRVSRAIAARYEAEFNLSIPEWRVMAVLGETGERTAGAIAEATEMDKVAISRAVARLKAAGRVAVRADAGDQRRLHVSLTAEGRAIYRRIVPLARAYERRLLDALPAQDQAMLDALLQRLTAAARAL